MAKPGLMPDHLAYILTSRRNGVRLDKTYGNHEAWFLYPTYEEAKQRLQSLPREDQKYWVIVPVLVRSDEEAWENMKNEKKKAPAFKVTAGPITKVMVKYGKCKDNE